MVLADCKIVGDDAVMALSRYRRASAAAAGLGPPMGSPSGHDAGSVDSGVPGGAAVLSASLDRMCLSLPANGTLASSAVGGGLEEARGAHQLTVPAGAAAARSSVGGGLERVSVAGCGHHRGVSESSVQVQDTFAAACNERWLAMHLQQAAAYNTMLQSDSSTFSHC